MKACQNCKNALKRNRMQMFYRIFDRPTEVDYITYEEHIKITNLLIQDVIRIYNKSFEKLKFRCFC